MKDCVYRGEKLDIDLYECQQFGRCEARPSKDGKLAVCQDCPKQLSIADKDFADRWEDSLIMYDRTKEPTTALRGMLAGGCAFLVGGGPSTRQQPLELLNSRGAWSLGVNNAAAHPRFQANAFVCSDPPLKFSHNIFLDSRVMKFLPKPKLSGRRARLRRKDNGVFRRMGLKSFQCPNIWGFQRNSWLYPDDRFFLDQGACWGNHKDGEERTGEQRTVCTMLLGLRLLKHLGAGTIFLVGVDFSMRPGSPYSWGQDKHGGGCDSNNRQFGVVNDWLCRMAGNGVFERFGLRIYNTFERSGLRAFPYVPFEDAIKAATEGIEQKPDLAGWYEKAHCPECQSWHIKWGPRWCECQDCSHGWDPVRSEQEGAKKKAEQQAKGNDQ